MPFFQGKGPSKKGKKKGKKAAAASKRALRGDVEVEAVEDDEE